MIVLEHTFRFSKLSPRIAMNFVSTVNLIHKHLLLDNQFTVKKSSVKHWVQKYFMVLLFELSENFCHFSCWLTEDADYLFFLQEVNCSRRFTSTTSKKMYLNMQSKFQECCATSTNPILYPLLKRTRKSRIISTHINFNIAVEGRIVMKN